jgi:excisionase family DNA binding protein
MPYIGRRTQALRFIVNRGDAEALTLTKAKTAEKAEQIETRPALITVEQARQALGGISRGTLYALINEKKLRSVRIGTRRLIPDEAIPECIALLPKD